MKKKILQLCLALVLGLTVSFAVVGCNPTTPKIEVSGVQRVFDLGSSFSIGQNAVVNKVQDGKTTALKSGEYTVTQNFDGQKQGVYTVTVTLQKDVSYAYDVAVVDLDGFSATEGQVLSEIALPFSQLAWKTPSASVGSVGSNSHAVVFNPAKGGNAEFNVKIAVSSMSTAKQNAWTVQPSIEGWTYGEEPKAPVGSAKYGTVVFEYYSDESLSAESKLDGAPVNAGTYWLVAKVEEGSNYTLLSSTVEFTVAKANNSWTTQPSIEGWTYGEAANAHAGAATYGTVVFEYYSDPNLSEASKLDGVPANAGTYWLVAKVAEGEDYTSLTSSVEFVIAKATNSWTTQPSIDGWTYGEAPKDSVGAAKYGTVAFEYYSDESLSADSKLDGVPANAGTYWLVAKVAEGEDYTSLTSAAVEFTVAKANNSWITQPSIEGWTYGEAAKAPVGTAQFGTVVFEYYSDESLSAESKLDGVPVNAGTYWLVATVAAGEDYNSLTSAAVEFTVAKADNSWTTQPSIEGWTYGEAANAPVGAAMYGTVVFEYYSDPNLSEASKLDGTPEDAGEYWIKAKVPESQNYNALKKYVGMLRIEKADVKVQQGPDAASANIGSLLSSVGINGGKVVFEKTNASGAVESVEVSGTWSWKEPQLEVTSTGYYAVAFTPDSTNFNKVDYSVMVQAIVPDGVSAIAKFGDAFSDSVTFVGNGAVYNATVPFGISQIRVILSSSQGGFREYRVGTGNVWNEWQQFSPSSYIVDLTFAETDYTKNHSVQAVTFNDETYTFNISFEAPLTLTVNGVKKPLSTVVDLNDSVVVSVSEGYTVKQSGINGFSFDNAYVIKSYDLDKRFLFEVTNTYGDFVLLSLNVANRFSQANINDAVWKLKPTGDNYFSYHYEYETLPSSIDVSFLVNPLLDKNHILRWKTNLSDKEFFMNGLHLNVPMYDGLNRIDIYVMEIYEDGNGYQQVSDYTITLSGQSVLEGFLAVTYDNSTHEFIKVPCDYDPETGVVTGLDFGYRFELQARFSSAMYAQRWETPDGTAYNFNDFGISNDVVLVVETSSGEVERMPVAFIFNRPVLVSDKNGDMVDATPNVSGDVAEFVVVQDVSQGPFTLTYGDKTVNLYETDGTPIENVYWEQKTDGKKVKFEILAGESDVFEGVVNFVQSTSPGAYIQQIIVYRTEKDRDDENFNNCTPYSVSNYPLCLDLYQGETPDDMLKRIAIKTFSNNPFQIEGDGNIRIVKVYEMASVVCRLPIIFVEAGAATDEIRINAVKETNKNYVFEWYEVTEENFELQIYHNEEVSIYTSNGGVKIDIKKDGRLLFTNYGFFTIGSVSDATISENGVYTVTFTSSDKTVTKTVVMEISILAKEILSLTDKNGESYSLFDDMSESGDWEFVLTAPGEGMAYLPADIVDSDGKVTFSYVSEVMTMSIGGEMLANGTPFAADTIAGSDGYNYVEAQLAVIGQTDAVMNVKIVFNR